jgi:hypothetical protein
MRFAPILFAPALLLAALGGEWECDRAPANGTPEAPVVAGPATPPATAVVPAEETLAARR